MTQSSPFYTVLRVRFAFGTHPDNTMCWCHHPSSLAALIRTILLASSLILRPSCVKVGRRVGGFVAMLSPNGFGLCVNNLGAISEWHHTLCSIIIETKTADSRGSILLVVLGSRWRVFVPNVNNIHCSPDVCLLAWCKNTYLSHQK